MFLMLNIVFSIRKIIAMEPVPTWDTLYVFNYRIHIEEIRIFFFLWP